jgi:hypothetical protein
MFHASFCTRHAFHNCKPERFSIRSPKVGALKKSYDKAYSRDDIFTSFKLVFRIRYLQIPHLLT